MKEINPQKISSCLWHKYSDMQVISFSETASTNTDAKKIADLGAKTTLITAEMQTGGRGRQGRSFYSPKSGIYMSLLVPLDIPLSTEEISLITPASAVAVCRAIENLTNIHCGIKWVNDIYLHGKKLGGILTETVTADSKITYVIIGIGLNFCTDMSDYPKELSSIATSLFTDNPCVAKEKLTAEIVCELLELLEKLPQHSFMSEYKSRSVVLGKKITVTNGTSSYTATATDFDKYGWLLVRDEKGNELVLNSGEITIRATEETF